MGCNESKSMAVSDSSRQPASQQPSQKQQKQKQMSTTQKEDSPAMAHEPIKFTHFGDGGRCVPLLMVMAYGGIQYENDIISPNDWPAMKSKTKMGTLPIMKVGSEELVSSVAILNYLGSISDLKGSDSAEQAACDALVYMIEECRGADLFLTTFLIKTQQIDEEARQQKAKEYAEGALANLSTLLESNITGSKWLLSKLTVADFWLYGTMKVITESLVPDAWSKMGPKVQKWKVNFESIPKLAQYTMGADCPKMKLTYFDKVRGRCEPYRMIFAHADIEHENEFVTFEEWPAVKPTTPMGYLPVLTVGEEEIVTSLAILNYIGSVAGLRGGSEETACATMVYMMEDCRTTLFPSRFLLLTGKMDEETKKIKENEFIEKDLAGLVKYLEEHITGDQWLLGELSVADFWLHGTMEVIEDCLVPDVWNRMGPKVQKWRKNFESLPKVKQYMESRPKDYTL